jgi:hypothetical protein
MKNNVNNEINQIRKMMGLIENFEPMAEDINSGEGVEMPQDNANDEPEGDDMHDLQMVIMSQLSDLQANGGGDQAKGKINFIKSLVMAMGDGKTEMSGADIDAMYDKWCGSGMNEETMEEGWEVDPTYTHFAVSKADGKIVNGWQYDAETDKESIAEYCKSDLKDMDLKPSDYKIATKGFMTKQGIDPFNSENWKSGVAENMNMDMSLAMEGELGEPDFQKKAEGGDGVYEETVKEGYYDEIEGYTSTSQNQSGYKDGDTVKHQHLGQTGTVYDVLVAPNKKDFLVVVKFDTGNGMKSIGKYGVGFSDINDIKKA